MNFVSELVTLTSTSVSGSLVTGSTPACFVKSGVTVNHVFKSEEVCTATVRPVSSAYWRWVRVRFGMPPLVFGRRGGSGARSAASMGGVGLMSKRYLSRLGGAWFCGVAAPPPVIEL